MSSGCLVLTFGEALLTYKPAPASSEGATLSSPLAAGVSTQLQAVGGSELNVAVALAQLDGPLNKAAWVSMLPEGPLGDLVSTTASALGVDFSKVQRLPDTTIGTLHVVDDGSGPRPHYQRRHSAFCTRANATSFAWAELLRTPRWLFLTGITPLLTPGTAAAWAAALLAVPSTGGSQLSGSVRPSAQLLEPSVGDPPYACVDLNHRPALGSLEELWVHIEPLLPKITLLILSEDSVENVRSGWPLDGLWMAS
jgi:sugar/nucleoside kinase (ribokinase family)